jgi:hypothetical protein
MQLLFLSTEEYYNLSENNPHQTSKKEHHHCELFAASSGMAMANQPIPLQ